MRIHSDFKNAEENGQALLSKHVLHTADVTGERINAQAENQAERKK